MTRIQLRNLWFQIHKWIGLAIAIFAIILGLTGAALVWDDGVDRLLHPARHVATSEAKLPAAEYVGAARAVLPATARIASLSLTPGEPVVVQAALPAAGRGRPARLSVYLDPAAGRVIEVADSRTGLLRTFHMLHGSLMIPGVGRQVVGWLGVLMLVSCISGLWLWWPTIGSWARGLRWRRQPSFNGNLHHLVGFWIALPLAVLSLTGAWISFPNLFGALEARAQAERGPPGGRASPLARPHAQVAIVAERAATRGQARVERITWPTDKDPSWKVEFTGRGDEAILVDDGSLAVGPAPVERRAPPASLSRTMRAIHDGHSMPFVWQLVIFLGGIAPALLAVTGVIMWLKTRGWRGELARKRRAVRG